MVSRILACFVLVSISVASGQDTAASRLIARVLPGHEAQFRCETIPSSNGRDVYEYEVGKDGAVVLRGNSDLSLAVAFNQYLRREAHLNFSWLADKPLELPASLPRPPAKVAGECLASERFFLNYCTFGYTLPWWHWDQWQRFIDWMAMNGINRPLLQSGQEATWLKVWEGYGLTEAEVCGYFTGPAQLPWHRMANLDHWGSPLPMSYVEGQRQLQVQILARARELGMKPILSGFAGHVPEALLRVRPRAKITRLKPGWGGLPADDATWYLSPEDPLFAEVQGRFIHEQADMYGTDHLYAADPFNEMTPPSWEPAYLAHVGSAIYDGMAAVDAKAQWYQMTWTFTYDKNWTRERLAAMLRSVPLGRMVLLDYVCETRELYKQSNDCEGLPFIWNYLGNFGGNTHLSAPLHKVAARITPALQVPNCIGVGSTLEGLGTTPVIYDLVFEEPWQSEAKVDVDQWIRGYAVQEAGRADPAVEAAWLQIASNVMVDDAVPTGNHGSVFQDVPDFGVNRGRVPDAKTPYRPRDLVRALAQLFKAEPKSQKADGYQYDVVNLTRQALGDLGMQVYQKMIAARDAGNVAEFSKQAKRFLEMGRDLDALLGTRHEFLLGAWIADARGWGGSPIESDYYEENAREIITSWHRPGGRLTDYASRQWNGLVREYYLPRWERWISLTEGALRSGSPFPKKEYADWLDSECARWLHAHEPHPFKPEGDSVGIARDLWVKYLERQAE